MCSPRASQHLCSKSIFVLGTPSKRGKQSRQEAEFLLHTRVIWREQKQARTPLLVLYFKSGTPNQNFRKETLAFRLNQEFCLLGLPKAQARGSGEECSLARWQKIGKEESLVLNVLPGGVSCLFSELRV